MDATSFLDCCDWAYLVGTFKYGRDEDEKIVENWAPAGLSVNPTELLLIV
jgi:hypothetical protein